MDTTAELSRRTGISERVIGEIRMFAEKYGVRKVILFGSRARGDFRERSDIDIAFTGGDGPRFSLDVDEETYTLLMFDIVNLDKPVQPELVESIRRDGLTLYERDAANPCERDAANLYEPKRRVFTNGVTTRE